MEENVKIRIREELEVAKTRLKEFLQKGQEFTEKRL
jgi:hypothetical protein